MKFERLYKLLCERNDYEDDDDYGWTPAKQEKSQIGKNLEKRSPQEVWRVAQDVRRHIEDYPDFNLAEMLTFSIKHFKKGMEKEDTYGPKYKEMISSPLNTSADQAKVIIDNEGKMVYVIYAISYYRRKDLIFKIPLKTLKRYNSGGNAPPLKTAAQSYVSRVEEAFNRTNDLLRHSKKRGPNGMEETFGMQGEPNLDINIVYRRGGLGNTKKIHEAMTDILPSDKNWIMNHYKIGTPEIYRYLIEHSYKLPKHPNEIPSGLQGVPRNFLEQMFDENKTPLQITSYYSRYTDSGEEEVEGDISYEIVGFARVLNIDSNAGTNYALNKKEAIEWMRYAARVYTDWKEAYGGSASRGMRQVAIHNFPSWYISTKISGDEEEYYRKREDELDLSFQSWMVMRWFGHNVRSTYFWKEMRVHGPAGTEETFIPGDYLSKIQDADLINGLKTSPENAFRAAAEREAREFEDKNKNVEFTYKGKKFIDTDSVKVIRNSAALKHEGGRLSHCVGGYGPSCISGRSLILSLPNSTAELDPQSLKVYQHRAFKNRIPPDADKNALQEWITANTA